jgi:hypothetical protein
VYKLIDTGFPPPPEAAAEAIVYVKPFIMGFKRSFPPLSTEVD